MVKIPQIPELIKDIQDLDIYNDDYEVSINGELCQTRACRVSAMPFNRIFPGRGKQRPLNQTELASYIVFSGDEEVTLTVKCKRDFERAILRPWSRNITVKRDGNELTFKLKECGQYLLELDDQHYALHIFYNPMRNYSEQEKCSATYYFGPGVHFEHVVKLRDNESIYIDDSAILFASVIADGAENVKIFGGGVICGSCMERVTRASYSKFSFGNIRMYNSRNIYIEDVILQDSSEWCLATYDCDGLLVDNVKVVGQWRYNTDGINPTNTNHVLIKNCFIRNFDDCICVKAINGVDMVIDDFVVENCIMMTDWGQCCMVGPESSIREVKNVVYRNCTCLNASTKVMSVRCHDLGCGYMHHIKFENINIEVPSYDTRICVYQETDDMVYAPTITKKEFVIADISNYDPNANMYDFNSANAFLEKSKEVKLEIHDVVLRNINITTELEEQQLVLQIDSAPEGKGSIIRNILIDGLYKNGVKISDIKQLKLYSTRAENVVLK